MFKNAWGDMKEFDSRYWSLVATSTALCGTYITFSGFAPDLLEKRYLFIYFFFGHMESFEKKF